VVDLLLERRSAKSWVLSLICHILRLMSFVPSMV
jgi:hypothetical protein